MPKNIVIIKSNGDEAVLDPLKITHTLQRAGATPELARGIAEKIAREAWRGMRTKEIYKMAMRELRKNHPAVAARYSLRDAIFRLGPAGFEFEKYMTLLLRAHGFKAVMPEILQGRCITHEVDILGEKDSRKFMAECKLRQSTNIYINIKDTMSTWARFIDLQEGAEDGKCPRVDDAWIITNSRFSYDSIQYGTCKKMMMLSWNTPKDRPLPAWIDEKKLYPITVLSRLNKMHLDAFGRAEILLLENLVKYKIGDLAKITRLPQKHIEPILAEAIEILDFEPNNKLTA
jgi:hypothetical protein